MRSYSERHIFTHEECALLHRAATFVDVVTDDVPAIRCHELARAFTAEHPTWCGTPLDIVDGLFGSCDHTWIERAIPGRVAILDVYSVGRLPMVQLVHHWSLLQMPYVRHPDRTDVRADVVARLREEWQRHQRAPWPTVRAALASSEGS